MAVIFGSWFFEFSVIFIVLVLTFILYFKWAFQYWKQQGVKTLPSQLLFGNIKDVCLQKFGIGCFFKETYFKLKAQGVEYFAGCYIFAKPVFLVLHPKLIKQVLVKDFDYFPGHGSYIDEEIDPLSGYLFSLEGERWKNLRAKLSPTFTSAKMKLMFPTLLDCTSELGVILERSAKYRQPIDVNDVMARFTTDVIGSCAFGITCNSLKNPDSEFRYYGKLTYEKTLVRTVTFTLGMLAPDILRFFKMGMFGKDISDFFSKTVKQTVYFREKNGVYRKDFMQLLIELKNDVQMKDTSGNSGNELLASQILTMEEITSQCFMFFIAGFETSATTLTLTLYELAMNQTVQKQLRDEISIVLEKYGGILTYDSLQELTYMDQCIEETIRKYPPVPFLARKCAKDYKVANSNVLLKKGVSVIIPTFGIHNDPQYYPNPEKYDPERFNEDNKAKRCPFTWLPFGEGPRMCIAYRFGLMQIKVGLVALLKNYQLTVNSRTNTPIGLNSHSFVINTEGTLWLDSAKICS